MKKGIKRTILWTLGIIVLAVVLIIVFISPLTKYLVEKYDEKILGRQVELGLAYVNPFTGYVHFKDVTIYEHESDTVFFHTQGLSLNLEMMKLLSGNYEISELSLNRPVATIIQKDSSMNFDDIILKFAPKDTLPPDTTKEPTHFSIMKFVISDGEFRYHDQVIPVKYAIKKVNINSTGYRWDSDTTFASYSFIPDNEKGEAKGDITMNLDNLDYRFSINLKKYDLKFIEQYVKDLSRYGSFDANLDADLHATGNFKDAQKLDANGLIGLNDFRFGKENDEDYASFTKLVLDIDRLNPAQKIYLFDSAILTKPYLKYERYDQLDNFSVIFGVKGENVTEAKASSSFNLIFEIADYVALLAKNFFKSNYKVDRVAIIDADVRYNDYALNEKFSAAVFPLNVEADSISKNKERVKVHVKSGLKPYGDFSVSLSINPKDSSDFDLYFKFDKIPTAMFNPYLITYTSFPMDRGTVEISGNWHVRNGSINSDNHFLVVDPRLANRVKRKDVQRLPLPLIMYFVRERANVIDYQIPISGNLSDPKFHLRDIIFDILTNIFVKPPTTGYRIKVKQVENEIEKSLTFRWDMRQTEIQNDQAKFMDKIAEFLSENKDATISVAPQLYEEKEKEYILFYEAKKKYYLRANDMSNAEYNMEDSFKVEKMSIRDSFFTKAMDKSIKGKKLYTIQDKCREYLGKNIVETRYKQLADAREKTFRGYFREKGVNEQVKFSKGVNHVPYNGFSFYRIDYKGEIPYNLYKAYSKMNDLDDAPPRRRFKKERRKDRQLPRP